MGGLVKGSGYIQANRHKRYSVSSSPILTEYIVTEIHYACTDFGEHIKS